MSAKELLFQEIQDLTEEQARQVLDAVFVVKQPDPKQILWEQLAKIPGIHVPEGGFKPFPEVEPIEVEGMPVSELLIKDRR